MRYDEQFFMVLGGAVGVSYLRSKWDSNPHQLAYIPYNYGYITTYNWNLYMHKLLVPQSVSKVGLLLIELIEPIGRFS